MTIARPAALLVSALLLAGCASGSNSSASSATTTNKAYSATPAKVGAMVCPITGEPVNEDSPSAMYGIYTVHCSTVADAKQFAALPPAKRAEAAAPQVLAQKRIRNASCPLTGAKLTAAAAPVMYENEIIGFATLADANQFNSLAAKKKKECIEAWKRGGEQAAAAQAK